MKKIYLANGKGVALVDDEDYDMLMEYKWHLKDKKTNHAATNIKIDGKYFSKRMHHFLIDKQDGYVVDHIDRNGLNNQKFNLRIITQSQNCMNTKIENKSSEYKGVHFIKRLNKFQSMICLNYESYYLGLFETKEEAALAYNKKAIELFGEFANLNVIGD